MAAFWGDGTTLSSDGQNFRTDSTGRHAGQVNPEYGQEPGRQFYTHISDQYSPFYICIISRVRDSTHVLDGLLCRGSDLKIREHYTDTAGFTDHVFALMHLLGFAFCLRIRDLHDKKLFTKGKADQYPVLQSLVSTTSLNLKEIEIHWRKVLRLVTSVRQGTVTASLMLKKLASCSKQNGLARALREIGRIERTLFMINWFRDPALRRRVQAGLNKGEARNALARAIFLHRLGEIRDRKPESQSYRASGLALSTAAISLWNTVCMGRAVNALKCKGVRINDQLLSHLSPLGWEHINLTGDYIWKNNRIPASGKFRRLRPAKVERSKDSPNDWFHDPTLRRRVQAGLNKGEARNALARVVSLHRPGGIRDRKPEDQSYRASGLTLLTAAISLWNTAYMERAVDALKRKGVKIND